MLRTVDRDGSVVSANGRLSACRHTDHGADELAGHPLVDRRAIAQGRVDYRLFPPEAIACVEAVKLWRSLGFSLKEMVELGRIVDRGPRDDVDRRLLAALRARERDLTDRMADLARQRDAMRGFCARYAEDLRRGKGAVEHWQAMQQVARDDYRQRASPRLGKTCAMPRHWTRLRH